jgi:hypothetical protein
MRGGVTLSSTQSNFVWRTRTVSIRIETGVKSSNAPWTASRLASSALSPGIGHVAARHSVQKISKQGPFAVLTNLVAGITGLVNPFVGRIVGGIGDFAHSLVFSPYSRSQEIEAERIPFGSDICPPPTRGFTRTARL